MSDLLSPSSPELDEQYLARLAHYAKHLGKAPRASRFSHKVGDLLTHRKGHGMEMLELRQYQAHDDPRHIDWRVSARTGELHTRLYHQESDHQTSLFMDLSASAYFGTRHTFIATRLVQIAGIIAWRCRQKKIGLSYQLQFGHHIKQGAASASLNTLLNELHLASLIKNREDTTPKHAVWHHSIQPRNTDLVILTDRREWSAEDNLKLQQLAQHNRVYWLQIIDSNMFNLPSGQYQLADQFGISTLTITKKNQTQAQERFVQDNLQLAQHLAKLGIQHQIFDLDEPPEHIARSLLAIGAIH